jgi:hypothetical protein
MNYNCLVSTAPRRRPQSVHVAAQDAAEAAFNAALELSFPYWAQRRPWVRIDGGCWLVTTGWTTYTVTIIQES